jgi:hypothetical protein
MMTKSKTALIAAFVLGTASAAFAQSGGEEIQNSQYQINPNAQVPVYSQPAPDAAGFAAEHAFRGQTLIEGRNVSVRSAPEQVGGPAIEERYPKFGGY